MNEVTSFLPVLVILTSALAAIPIALSGHNQNLRETWTFVAIAIKLGLLALITKAYLSGTVYVFTLCSILPAVDLKLKIDGFGLLFGFVAAGLWLPTAIYCMGYMRSLKEHAQTRFFCFFAIALSATLGVAFAGNLLTMYLFYELLSLSTYPLVTHHQDKDARTGGRKYLTYLLGTSVGFALPAMIITYNLTGSLEFSSLGVFNGSIDGKTMLILGLLFLFGFSKAGVMPFHSWLPGAMVAPTPVSSLLHAVAVVKVGVFCVVRILVHIIGMPTLAGSQLSFVLCCITGFTVIVASLVALSQDNLKRLLAFSTIGQLSYIILAVSLGSFLGVTGGVLHIVMHAFGKITLFFCAGAIFVATGKKYISQMKGIGRTMPFTLTAFLFGSLSIIGLPFSGGIISKWLMVNGAMQADKSWVLGIYLVSSFLNAAYFFPIIYKAFFCKAEDQTESEVKVKEAPLCALLPPVITATCSFLLFFTPQFFITLINKVLS